MSFLEFTEVEGGWERCERGVSRDICGRRGCFQLCKGRSRAVKPGLFTTHLVIDSVAGEQPGSVYRPL